MAEIRRLSVRERAIGGLAGDDGAVRAAYEHALVHQATGWLAGRLDCTVTEASGHLSTLAADSGVSLAEAATLLLGDGHAAAIPEQSSGGTASRTPMIPRQAGRARPRRFRNGLALARAKIERERREATLRMQRAILPARERRFRYGEFDIAVRYQPAQAGNQVGGDWYEARAGTGGGALVTIGDVAGHGLTAAAGMARIGNALRGMTVTGQSPDTLLHWLNDLVCTDETPEQVASAATGVLESGPPRLRWAQAGHPPPVLVRDGETRLLARPAGLLLGTVPGANYELTTEYLRPGDRLVLYTDGLIERRGRDIDVGLAKLLRAAACCVGAAAGAGAEKLAARLSGDGGGDDITVLVIAVSGPG